MSSAGPTAWLNLFALPAIYTLIKEKGEN